MTKTRFPGVVAGLVVACVLAGCNLKPSPPKLKWWGGHMKVLSVNPTDEAEITAATAVEAARINYDYRLKVLQTYYLSVGNEDKYKWATRERENLRTTHTFEWVGLHEILAPKGESVENADERLLVEYVITARDEYTKAVEELAQLYERRNEAYKAAMIRNLQERFFPERTYMYFLEAEIPPADLDPKPMAVDPRADALFAEALKLHNEGKPFFGITLYDKQRQALMKFLELVRKYPASNKMALSAFYIAEIYKEYFNENVRAVHWYERAWQWDPGIDQPARFQAAVVWDLRLQNVDKAVECYRLSLEHDPYRVLNADTARRRIKELTGQKE